MYGQTILLLDIFSVWLGDHFINFLYGKHIVVFKYMNCETILIECSLSKQLGEFVDIVTIFRIRK